MKGEQFLINHKPFYFTALVVMKMWTCGKGFDNVLIVHDHALMDWIGASICVPRITLTLKRCSTGQMNMASW
ncbi:glycoside hydrolase family 2 TIM barrel-domain containing protein [Escherichia coli]